MVGASGYNDALEALVTTPETPRLGEGTTDLMPAPHWTLKAAVSSMPVSHLVLPFRRSLYGRKLVDDDARKPKKPRTRRPVSRLHGVLQPPLVVLKRRISNHCSSYDPRQGVGVVGTECIIPCQNYVHRILDFCGSHTWRMRGMGRESGIDTTLVSCLGSRTSR